MNPSEEQQKARLAATGYTQSQLDTNAQAITSADLAPVPTVPTTIPEVPQASGLNASVTSPQAIIDTAYAETDADKQQSAFLKEIAALTGTQKGQTALTNEEEAARGVGALNSSFNEIVSQLEGLNNQALALQNEAQYTIPNAAQVSAEGRGITAAGLAPITASQLRMNQIKQGAIATQSLTVKSLAYAALGKLTLAKDAAEKAATARFEQQTIDLNAKLAKLAALQPILTREQNKRAEITKSKLEAEQKRVEYARADMLTGLNLANTVVKFNSNNPDALKAAKEIQALDPNSSTYLQDAFRIAGSYTVDPKAQYELESAKLDNEVKREQIKTSKAQRDKIIKETGEIGKPSEADIKADKEAKKVAEGVVTKATEQISQITKLLNHGSLQAAVGPSLLKPFARAGFQGGGKGDFIAGVKLLTSGGTLQTLLDLKQAGGTLGALSDGERQMLEQAFSKISTWEVKDEGVVVGYNTTEANFKKELDRIKTLANKAITKAGENLISSEEDNALDAYFKQNSAITPQFTNPAGYFNNP